MAFDALVDRFTSDLERLGATVLVTGDPSVKPSKIRIVASDRTDDCLLFLWNVTPGGKNRPVSERRIQVTATERFPLALRSRTIIGGWNEPSGTWAFWDVMRHAHFSKKSPSFQMRVETLERAAHHGIATQARRTDPMEIVVAVRPEFLLWYVREGDSIHKARSDATFVDDLVDATIEEENAYLDEFTSEDQATRRIDIVRALRAYRDAKFKPMVLRAYRYKCAVCGVALKLVDAAHIVPVKHPGSRDDVSNGLGLCRLHHAAFDNALMGIRSDGSIVTNPEVIARLRTLNLLHGFDAFWPAPHFLVQ